MALSALCTYLIRDTGPKTVYMADIASRGAITIILTGPYQQYKNF